MDRGPVHLLKNRYALVELLGGGGMGDVWLADDRVLGRQVAIKELVVSDDGEPLPVRRKRALREARAAAAIEHPSVVDIYDMFEEHGRPWIVMPYIRGRSLRDLIEDGPLAEREVARIGVRVLGALEAAHRARVLHRDVKPANILVGDDGRVYLADFGIAHVAGQSTLTGRHAFVGTLEFMAPERIEGRPLGPASDLWSLGVTFFCALEGYSPFRHDDVPAMMRAILDVPVPKPARPGPLAGAVERLLDKDPRRRMTVPELRAVLRSVIDGPRVPPSFEPTFVEPGRSTAPTLKPPRDDREERPPVVGPPEPTEGLGGLGPAEAARRIAGMDADTAARLCASMPPKAAGQALAELEPQMAGRVLAALPGTTAAAVLAAVAYKTAGRLLETMTSSPGRAASVLRTLNASRAGRTIDHMDLDQASALLVRIRPGEAARILTHAHARTAAYVVQAVGAAPAVPMVEALSAVSVRQACGVLAYVSPKTVATVLRALPRDRAGRILEGLPPSARDQVRRHLRGLRSEG
ncbi:protein kinase [Sphaerisporangium sp. NPDC051017]|uniref:protein kinase domain-containing protein n=1 Tax=Sphaerisporangium sp. NPDC051017 TaxID=3154636 RepID=UPI0034286124